MYQTLEIPTQLLQAIELAQRQREAKEKLRALDNKLAFRKPFSDFEFDEAIKAAVVLAEKNGLICIPKFD